MARTVRTNLNNEHAAKIYRFALRMYIKLERPKSKGTASV